jgi:hypothetical protein
MARRAERLLRWAGGLFVAGVLAFGSLAATATPASARDCPYDGEGLMGYQPSDQACYQACYARWGDDLYDYHWNESNGCCTCVF